MALSGSLLCMIVLCAINSQNSVFAQNNSSMPDLKTFFSDAIFPNSYPSTGNGNVGDRSDGAKGGSDAQDTTKAVDETTTATEVDETTTATEEEIEVTKKRVNEALFESGVFGLDF